MQRLELFLRQVHLLPIETLETLKVSSKCGSKICQVGLNVSETDIFESFQIKRQYKINHLNDHL